MRPLIENDIKNSIIEYLIYIGALVIRVNSGAAVGKSPQGKRRFIQFVKWFVLGKSEQTAGVADILAIYRGVPLAIECKTPRRRNAVSKAQQTFLAEWRQHGGVGIVASDVSDVQAVIESELE